MPQPPPEDGPVLLIDSILLPRCIADGEGQHWTRVYKGPHLIEEKDPLGHITQYAYNDAGLPTQITDAKGGVKQLAYNDAGQLKAYTDCSGQTSSWEYDELGQMVASQDAAGNTTRYAYDKGQLARVTEADGSCAMTLKGACWNTAMHWAAARNTATPKLV